MHNRVPLMAIVLLSFMLVASTGLAVDDGVYLLKAGAKGMAPLEFPGGFPAELDRKLGDGEYDLTVASVSNWNDQFQIRFTDKTAIEVRHYFAIALDGKVMVEIGGEHLFAPVNANEAAKISALKGREPVLRRHLGKELIVRFSPTKEVYMEGDAIEVSIQVKNVGDTIVYIRGEMPSDHLTSVFAVLVVENVENYDASKYTNVRNLRNRMTVGQRREILRPGQIVELKVEDVRNWYRLAVGRRYEFVGAYKLEVFDSVEAKDPAWVDHLAGEFSITTRARKK